MRSDTPTAISVRVEVAAPPERVWEVVSDVRAMPRFSPELRKVYVVRDRHHLGTLFVGINRRGLVAWPTTSVIVRWEPGRAIAWRTHQSGATWVYELEPSGVGTRLSARRVLASTAVATKAMGPLIGGVSGHDVELAAGVRQTLERIKEHLEL